jgi:uncharacterized cupredoxin-like copper-binding protein
VHHRGTDRFTKWQRQLMALGCILALASACGRNSGSHEAAPTGSAPRPQTYGRGALPSEAHRVVEVTVGDSLRFEPSEINVTRGEVVGFRITNTGNTMHEFTIGGPSDQELHDAHMASMAMGGDDMKGMDMSAHDHHEDIPNDAAHKRYMKALAKRIAELEARSSASDSVHVPPGETKEITWAFTGVEAPEFGCHIQGHWAGGMRGRITMG